MKQIIYLDNAATTKTRPEVVDAPLPYMIFRQNPRKPLLMRGRRLPGHWERSRTRSILRTAVPSLITGRLLRRLRLIRTRETTSLPLKSSIMENRGFSVTYLDVDEYGVVKLDELKKAIRPETILISVMFANNEIGTVQPIKEIGEIANKNGILFHTDAVQAFGHVPINVDECHIDMLSSSAHKLNGPRGVGFMYIRTGVKTKAFIHGGAQERKRRGGTENTPGIVGFGKAVEIAMATMKERTQQEKTLRDHLIERVMKEVPFVRLNGHPSKRLSNNANFAFQFIEGESLLIMLDMDGICGSSGSACTSGSLDPSHVLLAIGLPHEIAHGSLRLTLNEEITMEQIDFTVESIKKIVARLRAMSPLYEDYMKKQASAHA